jgi:two-component system, OmpR family, sensor histidine kinase ResE
MNRDAENNSIEMDLSGIQRLKSKIVTQISHEFRTPLTSIVGFAALLEEIDHIDDSQRTEYAHYIRNEGLRLTKIVNDLINLDALEQGRAHFLFELTEIQNIIHCAAARATEFALGKSISISKKLPNVPIVSKCDSERIIHALYQLLHNAIRFTKPCGSIVLNLEATNTDISISVQDTGPGIPAEDLPSLFKRFGKLYRPGEETHGTGVGLALAKHIVEQHGGEITVQSHVGEGSTFTIQIPIFT